MTIASCPACSNIGVIGERYCACPAAVALRARIEADPRIRQLQTAIERNLGERGPVLVTMPGGGRVLHPPPNDDAN